MKKWLKTLLFTIGLLSVAGFGFAGQVVLSPTQPVYRVTLVSGSLKQSITQVAHRFGWQQVIWQSPYDYAWTGKVTLAGSSLKEILQQILPGFPIQAVMYQGNHVLVIKSRGEN